MANNNLKAKLEKLEKVKQQIKDEERKIEQDLGKHILKILDLSHAEFEEAKRQIETLTPIKQENELDEEENHIDSSQNTIRSGV